MTLYHSPNIVTDELQIYLDAANEKSYPGSGSTWFDLSQNKNSGTLINGVGYDDTNQKSLVFDGTDDYFNMTAFSVSGLTQYSLSIWINFNLSSSGVDSRFFWHGNYGILLYKTAANNINLYVRTDSETLQTNSPLPYFDNFLNIAGTYDGSTMKLFINGVLKNFRAQSSGIVNSVPTRFWLGGASNSFFSNCKISNVSVYKKSLSETEIKQNFNALRGRYGI